MLNRWRMSDKPSRARTSPPSPPPLQPITCAFKNRFEDLRRLFLRSIGFDEVLLPMILSSIGICVSRLKGISHRISDRRCEAVERRPPRYLASIFRNGLSISTRILCKSLANTSSHLVASNNRIDFDFKSKICITNISPGSSFRGSRDPFKMGSTMRLSSRRLIFLIHAFRYLSKRR